jgi:hypothetical protein
LPSFAHSTRQPEPPSLGMDVGSCCAFAAELPASTAAAMIKDACISTEVR